MYLGEFSLIQSHFKTIVMIIGFHTEDKTVSTGSKCHLLSMKSSFYVLFTFLLLLPAQLGVRTRCIYIYTYSCLSGIHVEHTARG